MTTSASDPAAPNAVAGFDHARYRAIPLLPTTNKSAAAIAPHQTSDHRSRASGTNLKIAANNSVMISSENPALAPCTAGAEIQAGAWAAIHPPNSLNSQLITS